MFRIFHTVPMYAIEKMEALWRTMFLSLDSYVCLGHRIRPHLTYTSIIEFVLIIENVILLRK